MLHVFERIAIQVSNKHFRGRVQILGKPVYIILAQSPTYGMLGGVVDEVGFLQKGHFLLSN